MNRLIAIFLTAAFYAISVPIFAQQNGENLVAPPPIFTDPEQKNYSEEPLGNLIENTLEEEPFVEELLPPASAKINLRIINLRTGESLSYTLANDEAVIHENLIVKGRYCIENHSNRYGNNVAYLEVEEQGETEEPTPVFSGWVYQKFPSVSGVRHPLYSVVLTGCSSTPL